MKPIPFMPGQGGVVAAQQQTSISSILSNGVEYAYDTSRDANGWANTFEAATGNMSGIMLRVEGSGGTPPAGSVKWTSANTKIPHNLGWIPMGWLVTYKNKTCDIYAGTTPPDAQFIYLTISDPTADTNLFIF